MENKELWKAMIEWLEIERQTQERIAAIRRELAKISAQSTSKLDDIDIAF